jgi:HAD superfamily hydrolase (TIGR01549 family)
MKKAILFDLDGTLLPMDTEDFVQKYIQFIAADVKHLVEPQTFVAALWQATHAMINNTDPELTNEMTFEQTFLSLVQLEKEQIWPTFERFYEEKFPELHVHTAPTTLARKIVETAVAEGYRVAIATNPVFPRLAIEHRMRWAQIDDLPFELVTVYEQSRFTKPHPQYYQSIADQLGLAPEECIMVGNDVQEDLSAGTIGMTTFLVFDYKIDRGEPVYPFDDSGTLEDLYNKLSRREGIFQR